MFKGARRMSLMRIPGHELTDLDIPLLELDTDATGLTPTVGSNTALVRIRNYDDLFLDTDAFAPIETRIISEDVIFRIKRHDLAAHKRGALAVMFMLPAAYPRDRHVESRVVGALHAYAAHNLRKTLYSIIVDWILGIFYALSSLAVLAWAASYGLDPTVTTTTSVVMSQVVSVPMWYVNWQGLDYICYLQRAQWKVYAFYKHLGNALISFGVSVAASPGTIAAASIPVTTPQTGTSVNGSDGAPSGSRM